jgi:hypothetical protein
MVTLGPRDRQCLITAFRQPLERNARGKMPGVLVYCRAVLLVMIHPAGSQAPERRDLRNFHVVVSEAQLR